MSHFRLVACIVVATVTVGVLTSLSRADTSSTAAARGVDQQLVKEAGAEARVAQKIDDATYLRRVSLDLIGEQPTPEEITAFVLDPAPEKRARVVEQLLASRHFGQNWGRYWRDVILARRSDDRALLLVASSVTVFMTDHHNRETPWDEIARIMITADGDVRRNGATGILMAQEAKAEETAAEVSRIFLGMQIQCAQCHDHPYDDWTREQFHQLAAFFPRTGVRPKLNSTTRTFEVFSYDRSGFRGRPGGNQNVTLEHYMPDLSDPQAEGTLMTPTFFVTADSIETGVTDAKRRKTLAAWMTDPTDNPWFAKAYVNRIWAELVGRGFYDVVDDLGPDRPCRAPKTLDYLTARFVANGHDIKWLFRTIAATDAYQRESRSRGTDDDADFAASCPQPLRADQLFNALTSALGVPEQPLATGYGARAPGRNNFRALFNSTFGYDPSLARDEVKSSIPQVLLMMNAPQMAQAVRGDRPGTVLGKLLTAEQDNEMVATELYLRCLAREPSDKEIETCLEHVRSTNDRTAAFEDILWALINSAEFRHRR